MKRRGTSKQGRGARHFFAMSQRLVFHFGRWYTLAKERNEVESCQNVELNRIESKTVTAYWLNTLTNGNASIFDGGTCMSTYDPHHGIPYEKEAFEALIATPQPHGYVWRDGMLAVVRRQQFLS